MAMDYTIKPPHFLYTDEDGDFCMEWCFGEQGDSDSWRVMYVNSLEEGIYLIETRKDVQDCYYGEDATRKLPKLLVEGRYARKAE